MRIFLIGLFLIMLVLFVRVKVENGVMTDIKQIIESQAIEHFVYDASIRRFKLKENIEFLDESVILKNPIDGGRVVEIGKSILNVMKALEAKKYMNIRYIVIVEGLEHKTEKELSYKRALFIKNIWDNNGILFDSNFVDIQISGSGKKGYDVSIYIIPEIDLEAK